MAIITKKVGKKSYAYVAERSGGRVVHRYLGPADDPSVARGISAYKEGRAVPERFRSLFWDARLEDIHIGRNARYIIERVLDAGSLEALDWTQRIYPVRKIVDVLATSRGLGKKSKNFWGIWFGVENT
jgi:hypothetical protein